MQTAESSQRWRSKKRHLDMKLQCNAFTRTLNLVRGGKVDMAAELAEPSVWLLISLV